MSRTKNYKVAGVCAAMGVSLFPFKDNVIWNVEPRQIFHTVGEDQWKANFGKVPIFKALEEAKDMGDPDIIISSPDCGSGSILRMSRAKTYGNHKENHSLLLFFKAINKYKPRLFYFENLDGLFKSFPREEFAAQLPGYRLIIHVAPVSNWGNSQIHRKRLVIIGIKSDIFPKIDKYFRLPNYKDKIRHCADLYGDLDVLIDPSWGHIREDENDLTTIYAGKKISNKEITQHWNNFPNKKRWVVKNRKFSTAPGVYRNVSNDFPATARKANRQYDHFGLMLTPRQLARIQGVPDDFKIVIKMDKSKYWINKARAAVTKTPPYEISQWFKRKLEKTIHLWQTT